MRICCILLVTVAIIGCSSREPRCDRELHPINPPAASQPNEARP